MSTALPHATTPNMSIDRRAFRAADAPVGALQEMGDGLVLRHPAEIVREGGVARACPGGKADVVELYLVDARVGQLQRQVDVVVLDFPVGGIAPFFLRSRVPGAAARGPDGQGRVLLPQQVVVEHGQAGHGVEPVLFQYADELFQVVDGALFMGVVPARRRHPAPVGQRRRRCPSRRTRWY